MNSVIIFCAKYLIFLTALIALGYWLTLSKQEKLKVVVYGAITALVAFILAKIGSIVVNDPRPFVSDHVTPLFKYVADNGFPSDHTLLGASIAIAILFVSRKWGIVLLILMAIIGLSRVLAHVHHPMDILGSFAFALIGGFVAQRLGPKLMSRLNLKR